MLNFEGNPFVRWGAFSLALFLSLINGGCTPYYLEGMDNKYDHSRIYVGSMGEKLGEVIKSVYRVETSTSFRMEKTISTLKVVGMAVSLDDRHLLTAKHVTTVDSYLVQTPFGLLSLAIPPENKVEEKTAIVFDDGSRIPTRVIYRDEEMDFAILETEKKVTPPNYAIGNSEDFQITNVVIVPANFQTGLNIRIGYITQLDFIRYGPNGEVSERREKIFGISAVVNEGDSGSPILLLRDGEFELGGIISFIVLPARGLGYGLKITPIMERLIGHGEHNRWIMPLLRAKDK